MRITLIDTSIWISVFRINHNEAHRHAVQDLLEHGEAAWCGIIRLELWAGVRDSRERKQLEQLNSIVRDLSITPEVWNAAVCLADKSRKYGLSIPASDLLISACAQFHSAQLLHHDRHFDLLTKLD